MARDFQPGDVLIFQLESGFGLLKVLAIDETEDGPVWHLSAYEDFFLDPETADMALSTCDDLKVGTKHLALTNRAFESTQTAKMKNCPLNNVDQNVVQAWRENPSRQIHDRSIRLLLGFR